MMQDDTQPSPFLDRYMPDQLLSDNEWAGVAIVVFAAGLLLLGVALLIERVLGGVARRALQLLGKPQWAEGLIRRRVFRNIGFALPLLAVLSNLPLLTLQPGLADLLERVFVSAGVVCIFLSIIGVLRTWEDVYSSSHRGQTRSIKGYVELARIVLWAVCAILVVSTMMNRSPLLMLSGLGALSAVLLLVFKDTLLSLVASTQMSNYDMLRLGDWIEMPQAGADGFVVDMALHTVKVQNWDKTVTTIPTYKLFSESFRNWRHMFESGGRRIKRTLRIDASTVRFLEEHEIEALRRYALIRDYLDGKQVELEETNRRLGELTAVPANRRRLTNIGTFRAYARAYIQNHPEIRHDMLMLARMMEPQSEGIPIEIYCFTNNTAWVEYERIQGDIFDHLLAILPEFWLRLYQAPAGSDLSKLR
ncbi:mechanosensitive ion channel family protein [Yanghanlia caeni]|uniref:Mechanosensitive ion channel n=1 Tax=Yanghanlia caeni TaxID=3064283 RepID=A0ABU1D6H1_9BURK|nr:mechanosensitive ion channel [Alcaligenaceae bacterium LG-2]HZH55751.1 mechanosensitive ion channel domain-containing protein [Burkholderiaceae bacterium]